MLFLELPPNFMGTLVNFEIELIRIILSWKYQESHDFLVFSNVIETNLTVKFEANFAYNPPFTYPFIMNV